MDANTEMVQALMQLRPMIQSQDFAKIDAFAAERGLDFLISDAFIDFSRRVQDPSSVIFLATLAVLNAKQTARPQMILQAYQSISSGTLTEGIAKLAKRHVLRQTIAGLAKKCGIPPARLDSQKRKGTVQEWVLALELCLDHGALGDALSLFKEHMHSLMAEEFLLLCAKALFERAAGVRGSDTLPWKEWIALQTVVFHELKRRNHDSSAEDMAQLIGEYSHHDTNYAESIVWYQKIGHGSERFIISQYQIARGYSHLQDFDNAIAHLDDLLARICDKTSDWINVHFPNADPSGVQASNSKFDVVNAAEALTDLQNTLGAVGLSPFLVSGTLLGYVRNRGFLSHDKVIDVGIFSSQSIFDVVDMVSKSGLFKVFYKYLRMEKTYHVPVIHRRTGMSIDIFVYHPLGDKLVTGVQSSFGYTQNFAFTPFTLEKVQFLGIDFAIPANAALKLEENFGAWQVSDPYYISHLECPTTVDVGGAVYMVVARLEMLRALVDGKVVKVDRTAKILHRWSTAPNAMATDLIDRLAARFGSDRASNHRLDTTKAGASAHV